MAKSKSAKIALGDDFVERLNEANAAVLAEYRGIKANDIAALRVQLRKAKVEFRIVKNRVAKKAIEAKSTDNSPLNKQMVGPLGVALMYGDVAAGTKALLAFQKENELFKVTGGVMEGKALSKADLTALSDLPSREVLLARIIGTLVSPHRGLLNVLNGVNVNLVRVISAIKDTKA